MGKKQNKDSQKNGTEASKESSREGKRKDPIMRLPVSSVSELDRG